MLNYFKKRVGKAGEISKFRDIVLKELRDRGLNDPVQSDILMRIFPPVLIVAVYPDIPYLMHPEKCENTFRVSKTELSIKYGFVYKAYHTLVFLSKLNFVCGFIDHNDKDLHEWRAI